MRRITILAIVVLATCLLSLDAGSPKPGAQMSISGIRGTLIIDIPSTDWSKIPNMPDPRSSISSAGANPLTSRGTSPLTSRTSASGARSGTVEMQDFSVTKVIDKTSPDLALACASGTRIPEVTIEVTRAGRGAVEYLVITMENVIITSISPAGTSGTGGLDPLEEISFQYEKLTWESASSTDAERTPTDWTIPDR